MTSAQRRATKRYRERRRRSGLKRLEVQVPAQDAAVICRAAAILVMRQIDRDRKDPVLGGPRDVDL